MRLLVRNVAEGGSFQEHDGDLSLGGVAFQGPPPPAGSRYEVRFRLPNHDQELSVQAEPIAGPGGQVAGKGVQLRFVDVDTATELAIAKYLDDLAGTAR